MSHTTAYGKVAVWLYFPEVLIQHFFSSFWNGSSKSVVSNLQKENITIFAKSFTEVSGLRFEGRLFIGYTYARTNYLGTDISHRDTPQAL